MDRGEAARGSDPDDAACDGVGGADRDAESGVHHKGKPASRFRSEAAESYCAKR
jgi:hypothetical protein